VAFMLASIFIESFMAKRRAHLQLAVKLNKKLALLNI